MKRSIRCCGVRRLIPEAVDAEPDSRVLRVVELHADACESCAAELAGLRQAMSLLEVLPEVSVSEDFERRLLARVRSHELGRWTWDDLKDRLIEGLAVRPLASVALASVLVLVALSVFPRAAPDAALEIVEVPTVVEPTPAPRVASNLDPDRLPVPAAEPAVFVGEVMDNDRLQRSFDLLESRSVEYVLGTVEADSGVIERSVPADTETDAVMVPVSRRTSF